LKRLSYLSVGATGLKAGVNGSAALVVIANALVIDFAKNKSQRDDQLFQCFAPRSD